MKNISILLSLSLIVGVVLYANKVEAYSYGKHEKQQLDVYRAEGENRPAIMLVHGGAWLSGDKKDFADLGKFFARKGFTAISVGYRLTPSGARWPDIKQDINKAMWWIKEHATELNIDASRVCAMGGSAGGQLVAYLATHNDTNANGTSSKPNCIISWGGPWDLTEGNGMTKAVNEAVNMLMKNEDPKIASPIKYISKDTSPALLIHGEKDDIVPVWQTTRSCTALKEIGAECDAIVLKGEAHVGLEKPEHVTLFLNAIEAFVKKHLTKNSE